MSESDKQKFEDLHNKDKERFDNQMKELKENGFYMTEDGKKSSDLPPAKQKATKKQRAKLKAELEQAEIAFRAEREKGKIKDEKKKA